MKSGKLYLTVMVIGLSLAGNIPWASAAVDKVICVPWQGDTAKFHATISGQQVRLKGVIKTTTSDLIRYRWVFGDGTTSGVTSLSGSTRYNVAVDHTFVGAEGTPITAMLQVDDQDGSFVNAVVDNYLLKIEADNLDARVNIAIDNGLWYLYTHQFTHSYLHSFNTLPINVWSSYGNYYASQTASAIQAFEINGHKETGDHDQDPYAEAVKGGLNWLFNGYYYNTSYPMLQTTTVSLQHSGVDDPEEGQSSGNGKGIQVRDYDYRPIYEGGMVMDAIIASGTPDADCGRDFDGDGINDTYRQVVQDMIDQYAAGQYDGTSGGYGILGGWRYGWGDFPDNSAAQWAAIGMIPAQQTPWNCVVPGWVKSYNDNWLNYSHYQWNWDGSKNIWGGFGYTGSGWGDALTPSGMVQLAFVGASTSDQRWVRTERWFADNWKDTGRDWLDRHNVYGYYAFTKAMRLAQPSPVEKFASNNFDWYRGTTTTMGLAKKISDQLISAHNWNYYGSNLGTAWCVIILKPALFAAAPIPCFTADPNPTYEDADITFNPSCSDHSETGKGIGNIVLFEWDWDNDGIYDSSSTDPDSMVNSFNCGGGSLPCSHPVTLRVTDDNDPALSATTVITIDLTNPPHPPSADANGPYMVSLCGGDSLGLDGSESFDPNTGEHEAGCQSCEDDGLISWEWDLIAPLSDFSDETGETVMVDPTLYFGVGTGQPIGLRVTDNTANAFPGSGEPNLTDANFTTVDVYDNCYCDLGARAKNAKIQLTWIPDGSTNYDVYRSVIGPNSGFVLIASGIVSDYATYLDQSVTNGIEYWYRVVSGSCGSPAVSAVPRTR